MKRTALIKRLRESGAVLIRHGAKHDWYQNRETGVFQPVLSDTAAIVGLPSETRPAGVTRSSARDQVRGA